MNVFKKFLTFSLRKFNPFREYVYYSLVDRDIYFFDKPGENELIVTGLPAYQTSEDKPSGLIFPIILNRDFVQTQTINHGRPEIIDPFTTEVTKLSSLTFVRAHSGNTTATVSATVINEQGIIEYVRQDVPRFEYGSTRVNLLSSSEFIPSHMSVDRTDKIEDGILHINLTHQTISGTSWSAGWTATPYQRPAYGWEPREGYLPNIKLDSNDLPNDLLGKNLVSQYIVLSSLTPSNYYGGGIRNSSIGIYYGIGNELLPYAQSDEWAAPLSLAVDTEWRRISLTTTATYWANRNGALDNWSGQKDNLWNGNDRYDGLGYFSRVPNLNNGSPMFRIFPNPYASNIGAFAFWGFQIDAGPVARPYQTNYSAMTADYDYSKNLIPPISAHWLRQYIGQTQGASRLFLWNYYNGAGTTEYNFEPYYQTPFGVNTYDPGILITPRIAQGSWGVFYYAPDELIRLPERIAPDGNLLRNSDFSGALVGPINYIASNGYQASYLLGNAGLYQRDRGLGTYYTNYGNDGYGLADTTISIVSTGQINGLNFIDVNFRRTQPSSGTRPGGGHIMVNFDGMYQKIEQYQDGQTLTGSLSVALVSNNVALHEGFQLRLDHYGFRHYHPNWPVVGPPADVSWTMREKVTNIPWSTLTSNLTCVTVTDAVTSRVPWNTAIPHTKQRIRFSLRSGDNVYGASPYDGIPPLSTFNITLRLCGPKLELGSIATPYIPSPTITCCVSTFTYSCYIKQINGYKPEYWEPDTSIRAQSYRAGVMQRIGYVDRLRIPIGTPITVSMYVKIAGPGLLASTKYKFRFGVRQSGTGAQGKENFFYATSQWTRIQKTAIYTRDENFDNTGLDGQGFTFLIDTADPENAGINLNTTKFYFAGLQCEIANQPTPYIPTSQTQVAKAGVMKGLLVEPQRINIAQHSLDFSMHGISSPSNQVRTTRSTLNAPDDSNTATALSFANNTAVYYITGCNSGILNTRYTVSLYMKLDASPTKVAFRTHPAHDGSSIYFVFDALQNKIVDLSRSNTSDIVGFEKLVDGWYRVYFTSLCNQNNGKIWPGITIPANQRTVNIWGLQIEQGEYPTSYIPVSGNLSMRGADILALSGGNLKQMYDVKINTADVDVTQSTIYMETYPKYKTITQQQSLLQIIEKNNTQNAVILGSNARSLSSVLFNVGASLTIPAGSPLQSWVNYDLKTALGYNSRIDRFSFSTLGLSSSAILTNNFQLCAFQFGGPNFTGYIEKILIFPELLTLSDLSVLTQ